MSVRPFRFAVSAINGAKDGPSWAQVARDCEDLGYDTLFVIDHVEATRLAPIAAMAHAAAHTTTLRIGSLVLNAELRHPGLLAKELATIEALSGGRLEIGLGAGWLPGDYSQLGLAMDPPADRIRRLREAATVIRSFTATEEHQISFDGEWCRVADLLVRPRPVRPGGPPLLLGGGGRQVLTLAGRLADIVSVNVPLTGGTATVPRQGASDDAAVLGRIETVASAAGDRFDRIELQSPIHHLVVTDRPSAAAEELAARLGVEPDALAASPTALIGTCEAIIELLLERRERYGFSYVSIPDAALREFAPVVDQLRGR
jgi:probable F420-dependent oxidoreductase